MENCEERFFDCDECSMKIPKKFNASHREFFCKMSKDINKKFEFFFEKVWNSKNIIYIISIKYNFSYNIENRGIIDYKYVNIIIIYGHTNSWDKLFYIVYVLWI